MDDEHQARYGFRDLIDWQTMGICVCADAEDGDEALKLVEKLRPDILLTDVRMNRMDGLTLAREARKILPNLEIVFVSGYSEPEYIRQALRVEAFEYLYKPVRVSEVEILMGKLTSRLDSRLESGRQVERMKEMLEKNRPFLLERLLRSWIHGNIEDAETLRTRLELLGLSIPQQHGVIAVIFQPEWAAFPMDGQAESYLMLLEGAARDHLNSAFICVDETEVVALVPVQGDGGEELLPDAFINISNKLRVTREADLLIGVGLRHSDWMEVPAAVREARLTLERRISSGEETVFYFDDDNAQKESRSEIFNDSFIEYHLLAGQFEALWSEAEERLSGLRLNYGDTGQARKMLMSWALRADLAMAQKRLDGIDALSFCRKAIANWPVVSAKEKLKAALRDACARISTRQENTYSTSVARVLEIIRTEYHNALNVESLAEQVHYSSAHLSAMFRQETGITIGEALFRTRISAAMEMLRSTEETVSAIARKSGYTDVQYFSRVFKRFTGITPLQYRKKSC